MIPYKSLPNNFTHNKIESTKKAFTPFTWSIPVSILRWEKSPCSVLILRIHLAEKALFQLSYLNFKSYTQLYLSGVALNELSNILY